MKKFFSILILATMFVSTANAQQTIMILDANGQMKQQIYAYPASTQVVTTSQSASVAPQPVAVQPQQVVAVQPYQPQEVVVVRQTVRPRNYYYDSAATTFFAGLTGAVIGNAIFHPHHHHHGHRGHRGHHHRR